MPLCKSSQGRSLQRIEKHSAHVLPKQVNRLAGALLANAGFAGLALAEDAPTINFGSSALVPESLTSGLTSALPSSLPEVSLPDVDTSGFTSFIAENPIIVGGGAFLLALPFGIQALFNIANGGGASAGAKATTPDKVLEALSDDSSVILVDIRSKVEAGQQGSPDLRSVKRRAISLPLTKLVKGEYVVEENFIERFAKISGLTEDSIVILLDSDGSESTQAAKQLIQAGSDYEEPLAAQFYFVQGGAEAWQAAGAPWRKSGKLTLPSLNFKAFGKNMDTLAEEFKEAPSLTKATVAAGALAGAGVLLFNEIEVVIELVGLLALGQFALKFVFAEEREKTMTEIKTLVEEKVAVAEAGEDLKKIATVLLEDTPSEKPAAAVEEVAVKEPPPASSYGSSGDAVPDDVKEAKEWIDNYKARSS